MSHQFYDFDTLQQGTSKMVETIKELYQDSDPSRLVSPPVTPGFLRNSLPENPPQIGIPIEDVIEETKNKVYPGIMLWQSPRFFGYFPSSIAVTNILAQMFATTFHSPAFSFALSPSHTEMENITVDWVALALGLPKKFLLENQGGGTLNNSMTQSILVSVHAAKHRKMKEINVAEYPERIVKLVGYYADFSFWGNQRALKLKEIMHYRAVPVSYCETEKNLVADADQFEKMVSEDVEKGLIPFWYGATLGSTFSCATDVTDKIVDICKKYGMWVNVDAAYLGSSWICEDMRPDMTILEKVDSVSMNFSKSMFMGNGGNIFFVADKRQLIGSMGADINFSFFKNEYSGRTNVVDYKDWSFGLMRKNNSMKFYYLFRHYGLQQLRGYVRSIVERAKGLQGLIQNSGIFKMFCPLHYGLVCFQLCDENGVPNNELTRALCQETKNIPEGFMSPGVFQHYHILRIAIGNNTSTPEVIEKYFLKIEEAGKRLRNKAE